MRVIVAGADPTHVARLVQALPPLLPQGVPCTPWHDALIVSPSDDVVLLLGVHDDPSDQTHVNHTHVNHTHINHTHINHTHINYTQADQAIRHQLMQRGVTFQVIYGEAAQRLQQARHAVAKALSAHHPALAKDWMREELMPRWQGVCEACSDPDCEHRLFGRLFGRLLPPNASLK